MRIFLDTNVWISALFSSLACESVMDECIASEDWKLLTSHQVLQEFECIAIAKFGAPPECAAGCLVHILRYS